MSIQDYMTIPYALQRQRVAAKNANGQATQSWVTQGNGFCYIAPRSAGVESPYQIEGMVYTHSIYTMSTMVILAGDKVVANGVTYVAIGADNYDAVRSHPAYSVIYAERKIMGSSSPTALAPVLSVAPSPGITPYQYTASLTGVASGDTWDLSVDGVLVASGLAYNASYTNSDGPESGFPNAGTYVFTATAYRSGLSVDSSPVSVVVTAFNPVFSITPSSGANPITCVASVAGLRSGDTWTLKFKGGETVASGIAWNGTYDLDFERPSTQGYYATTNHAGDLMDTNTVNVAIT